MKDLLIILLCIGIFVVIKTNIIENIFNFSENDKLILDNDNHYTILNQIENEYKELKNTLNNVEILSIKDDIQQENPIKDDSLTKKEKSQSDLSSHFDFNYTLNFDKILKDTFEILSKLFRDIIKKIKELIGQIA